MGEVTVRSVDLEKVLSQTLDGIFVVDRDRRFLLFNEGCSRITGYDSSEIVGAQCRCHEVVDCEDEYGRSLAGRLCPGLDVLQGAPWSRLQRMRLARKDGGTVWVETAYTPIKGPGGKVECVVGVMRDVSESMEKEEFLRGVTDDLRGQVERLQRELREHYGFASIISKSPAMRPVLEQIRSACTNASSVLIVGEAGTNKEDVARTIHYNGLQKDRPFVAVACEGFSKGMAEGELFGTTGSKGLIRAADGGTLYLEEVGALSHPAQARLLRALKDRTVRPVGDSAEFPVDVRVIATADPAALNAGAVREDLHYFLSVIRIQLPPLRERKEDIPYLVGQAMERFSRKGLRKVGEIGQRVWDLLVSYDWPGNERDLTHAIESALATGHGPTLQAADLPGSLRGDPSANGSAPGDGALDQLLAQVEKQAILSALQRAGGRRNRAAKLLAISRSRLYRRLEALQITTPKQD